MFFSAIPVDQLLEHIAMLENTGSAHVARTLREWALERKLIAPIIETATEIPLREVRYVHAAGVARLARSRARLRRRPRAARVTVRNARSCVKPYIGWPAVHFMGPSNRPRGANPL